MNNITNTFKKLGGFLSSSPQKQEDTQATQPSEPDSVTSQEESQTSKLIDNSSSRVKSKTPIEGFVDITTDASGENLNFYGLLVPGTDSQGNLRGRRLLLDRRAGDWFQQFCWDVVRTGRNIPVRMRVTITVGNNRAYVIPCASDVHKVMLEWGRLQEEKLAYPKNLSECESLESICQYIYRKVADERLFKIISWGDDMTALAITNTGAVFRMYGGAEIAHRVQEVGLENIDLESLIKDYIVVLRTDRI